MPGKTSGNMSIKPICDKCKRELKDFGGILFSPPDENNKVEKSHLCRACYEEIIDSFQSTLRKQS
jgi:hypothetical protein